MKISLLPPVGAGASPDLPNIASALHWRSWDAGLAEAGQRRVPIVALAEPRWTNSAQRLGLVLGRDERLCSLLEDDLVPVLVDPIARPDLAAWWRWAAIALTGNAGPPLLVLLTHHGLPFLSYGSIWPEGKGAYPSLASLARATIDAYAADPSPIVAAAEALQRRGEAPAEQAYSSASAYWGDVAAETDERFGGFREEPKHPHPQLLWLVLDLIEAGQAPDAEAFVGQTLQRLVKGGINDQLLPSFHRCARDERWVVPHFEKPLPLNAQLSAVYARAARLWDDPFYRDMAAELTRFCLTGLKREVDAVAADSRYYTWTSGEIYQHVSHEYMQAVAFSYHITPDDSRQVLYQAMEPEAMEQYSYESPDVQRDRVERGRRQLSRHRGERPSPELVRSERPAWRAETIRWLVSASGEGAEAPLPVLEESLERLLAGAERTQQAEPGDFSSAAPWLEDRAALLAATVTVAGATGRREWVDRAQALADETLDRFGSDDGWRDAPAGTASMPRSWAVSDDIVPAAIGTVTGALADLGHLSGDTRYRETARRLATPHLAMARACGPRVAGFWRAWLRGSTRP